LPGIDYTIVENNIVKLDDPITFETIKLNNEWDVKEICNVFKDKKRVTVRSDLPGCGKSYACEYMKTLGHKVLFVCPTNELLQNYNLDGVTHNRFLV
jgi:superfamily II DNA or RNA helicase